MFSIPLSLPTEIVLSSEYVALRLTHCSNIIVIADVSHMMSVMRNLHFIPLFLTCDSSAGFRSGSQREKNGSYPFLLPLLHICQAILLFSPRT